MFSFLRGVAIVAVMMFNCGAAFAEVDQSSANYMMPGCHHFLQPDTPPTDPRVYLIAANCAGIIEGLGFAAILCIPPNVTKSQAVSVVVKYIDDRPARLHENFKALALEALQAAWPCKK